MSQSTMNGSKTKPKKNDDFPDRELNPGLPRAKSVLCMRGGNVTVTVEGE